MPSLTVLKTKNKVMAHSHTYLMLAFEAIDCSITSEYWKISFRYVCHLQVVENSMDSDWLECIRRVGSIFSIGFIFQNTRTLDEYQAIGMCSRSGTWALDGTQFSSARNSIVVEGLEVETERAKIYISNFRSLIVVIVCFYMSAWVIWLNTILIMFVFLMSCILNKHWNIWNTSLNESLVKLLKSGANFT